MPAIPKVILCLNSESFTVYTWIFYPVPIYEIMVPSQFNVIYFWDSIFFTLNMYFCAHLQKTKPTQHSVRELRALGLTPHFLACRSAQVCTSYIHCLYASQHSADIIVLWCVAAFAGKYKAKTFTVLPCPSKFQINRLDFSTLCIGSQFTSMWSLTFS